MDLYYRGFDPNDRVRSGALHLSAAAARLAASIVLSIPQLPAATWAELKRLLTVETLWGLCIVLAGWLLATVLGGLVGLAVNGLLIAYGALELWESLKSIAGAAQKWMTAAYSATTPTELAAAGTHFAEALSAGGVTWIELVVTHRAFRAVEGRVRKAIPAPEWLRQQYEDALRKRDPAKPRVQEGGRRAAEVAEGLRGPGVQRVAARFPAEAVAITGAFLGMAVLGGAALALAASPGRRR